MDSIINSKLDILLTLFTFFILIILCFFIWNLHETYDNFTIQDESNYVKPSIKSDFIPR